MSGNPLSDPRVQMLEQAAPAEVDQLGQRFTQLSYNATELGPALQKAVNSAPSWDGSSASAFRHWAPGLEKNLPIWANSYSDASNALDTYGMNLALAQSKLKQLIANYEAAQKRLTDKTKIYHADQATENAAWHAYNWGPTKGPGMTKLYDQAQADDNTTTLAYDAMLQAQADVDAAAKAILSLLDHFDDLRHDCCSMLATAIQDLPQWNEDLPSGRSIGSLIAQLAVTGWDAIKAVPGDLSAYLGDPTNPKKLAKLAADLATAATTVGSAAAIALLPADAADIPALAPILKGLQEVSEVGVRGALAAGTTADVKRVLNGDGDVPALVLDAAGILLDAGGTAALHAPEQVVTTLKPLGDAAEAFQAAEKDYPGDPEAAFNSLDPAERKALTDNGFDPNNDSERNNFIASTIAVYTAAEQRAKQLNAINGAVQYGGTSGVTNIVGASEKNDK